MRSFAFVFLAAASAAQFAAAQDLSGGSSNNQPILYGSETSSIFRIASELLSTSDWGGALHVPPVLYSDDIETAVARQEAAGNDSYTHIQVAVAVRASGWVGFGISEAGGMLGADMALFETENPTTIKDSYVVEDFAMPKVDDCQHWTFVSEMQENGWLIVEMSRPLDTKDMQDHAIVDDSFETVAPTRLIAAWGDTPTVSYHASNVGKMSTKIFSEENAAQEPEARFGVVDPSVTFEEQIEVISDGYFQISAANHSIPATETTYHYVCKSFDELRAEFDLPMTEDGTLTMVGGGAVLSPETVQYVHHFIVYGSSEGSLADNQCGPQINMLAGWAPGEEPNIMPENIGITIGPGTPFNSIVVEIHYNNPGQVTGLIDSSGFRVYYSEEPREIEAAFMQVGDPAVQLFGEDIPDGLTEYSFYCAADCTSLVLNEPVTVLAESLHMHKTGVRMTNELIRNGEVVNYAGVEVFDFDQQGSFKVQQKGYQIQAGDEFRTTCYYRDGSKFGAGSQEEMCMAFLLYYPKKTIDFGSFGSFPWSCYYGIEQLPVCKEELEFQTLETEEDLERRFGASSASECMMVGEETGEHVGTETPEGMEPEDMEPEDIESEDMEQDSEDSSASLHRTLLGACLLLANAVFVSV